MGRLHADPGEKHEPRVAISGSQEPRTCNSSSTKSVTTGALEATETDLRLLT